MSAIIDLTGMNFGRWFVLGRSGIKKKGCCILWSCVCECGIRKDVRGDQLKQGLSKSCGCLKKQKAHEKIKHGGASRSRGVSEYSSWQAMKMRCTNKNFRQYCDYGGRGIKVCDRWVDSFENFLADMGRKPTPNHSLDRFPNKDGDYEPGNCRWATKKEQERNKRTTRYLEYNGERMIAVDWAARLGVHPSSIYVRIKSGMSDSEIIQHYMNKKTAA